MTYVLLSSVVQADELFSKEALSLHSDQLSFSEHLWRADQGVRLFWGNYYLLSEHILWSPETPLLQASGQVELGAPKWTIKASHLSLNPQQNVLQAQNLQTKFQGFKIFADTLLLHDDLWQFSQVTIHLQEGFGQLKADKVLLMPDQAYENLIIEGLHLPLGLKWPWIKLTLPGLSPDRTEIRPPLSLLQPEFNWQGDSIVWGLSSQLWQTQEQRLITRLHSVPLQGWQNEWIYEWRPGKDYLLSSQLNLNATGPHGRVENLWKTPLNTWLRAEAQWQAQDNFWQAFWLPESRINQGLNSSLNVFMYSEWENWFYLSDSYLLGARWPKQAFGGSFLGHMPLWHFTENDRLWASVFANVITDQHTQHTFGARILEEWQIIPKLKSAIYLEQYLSSLDPDYFWSPERLQPWLGAYTLWQLNQDLGVGLELALSPLTQTITRADLLLTWKLRPLYINLLLRGVPTGLNLGLQFKFD